MATVHDQPLFLLWHFLYNSAGP